VPIALRYSPCSARAPYYIAMRVLPGITVCAHITARFSGGVGVGEDNERKMCVLTLSTHFVWIFFRCKKNSARYDQKCILALT
jgi:hypothetical protein